MWQFAAAVRGLADACLALGGARDRRQRELLPTQPAGRPIGRTPVVGVLGVHDDVRQRLSIGFGKAGASVLLLGRTAAEFGGSLWASVAHGHLGGRPPAVDLAAERRLAAVFAAAAAGGLLTAAHDLSDGGLAIALAECCLATRAGCTITLPGDPFTSLFSESSARAVVAVRPSCEEAFAGLCADHGVPATVLGTTGGTHLTGHRRLQHLAGRARRRTPRYPASDLRLTAAAGQSRTSRAPPETSVRRRNVGAPPETSGTGRRAADARRRLPSQRCHSTPGSATAARRAQRAAGGTRQSCLGRPADGPGRWATAASPR